MGRSSRIAAEAASQVSGGGGASSDDGGVGFVTGKEVDEFRTYDDTLTTLEITVGTSRYMSYTDGSYFFPNYLPPPSPYLGPRNS